MSQILRGPIFNIFNLLNRKQKKVSEEVLSGVKKYEKKEWKFILPADSEERVSKWPELMTACSTGDAAKVSALLQGEDEIDVNQQDDEGVTPLLLASRGGHAEIVQQLLSKGAQADAQSKKGKTALMKACKYGNLDVVKLLLDGNVNLCSNVGTTALMYASLYAQFNQVLNDDEEVPAKWASSYTERTEITKLLLNYGAKVNMHDNKGLTALMCASFFGHTETVKLLLDHGAKVDKEVGDLRSFPVLFASVHGHTEVLQLLLDRGAEVNIRFSDDGDTALMFASDRGNTEIVQLLLDHGAQVNMQDSNGYTPLMIASNKGHSKIVKLLLDHGAQVNMPNSKGQTALMCASMMHASNEGYDSVVKLLIDHGAELEIQSGTGETPLMKACKSGNIEAVMMLLDGGANINAQDAEGQSALLKASKTSNTNLINLLLKRGAQLDLKNGHSELAVSIVHANSAVVLSLLEHGARVNITDINGRTPLTLASKLGLQEIFEYLVFYGADLNLQDSAGKSALIHAVCKGHRDIATQLIELGAEINSQDNDGWSALMYAVNNEDLKSVQCLLSNGASVRLRNSGNFTVFDMYSRVADKRIIPELFQTLFSSANDHLEIDWGIVLSKTSVTQHLSSSASTIDHLQDVGISVSVPENSLGSPEESVELCIRPCFTGPFELPDQYESASPAYLIHHGKTNFQKDINIRIHHYASLQSEEDCKDMAFLTASSIPEYRGSRPVYTFKEIPGVKGVFRPGDQVGEISLRHFCFTKIGKRKRNEESSMDAEKKSRRANQCLYSARLYRNIEQKGKVSAIFCICLFSPIYMKHCDKVIMTEYTGMSGKGEGRSQVYAQIVGEVVEVNSNQSSGMAISFDKKPTRILKRDVHIPELMDVDVSQLVDYPPRLLIYVKQTECSSSVSPPEVQVIGLDRECSFELPYLALLPSQKQPFFVDNNRKGVDETSSLASALPNSEGCHGPEMEMSLQTTEARTASDSGPQIQGSEHLLGAATMKSTHKDVLGLDDLGDVLDAVETLSAQWRLLSTKLRLKPSSLDIIKQNHPGDTKMCLYEALEEWLRMNYDHQRHGRPSWKKLAEAVKSLDYSLFEKIVKEQLS